MTKPEKQDDWFDVLENMENKDHILWSSIYARAALREARKVPGLEADCENWSLQVDEFREVASRLKAEVERLEETVANHPDQCPWGHPV